MRPRDMQSSGGNANCSKSIEIKDGRCHPTNRRPFPNGAKGILLRCDASSGPHAHDFVPRVGTPMRGPAYYREEVYELEPIWASIAPSSEAIHDAQSVVFDPTASSREFNFK